MLRCRRRVRCTGHGIETNRVVCRTAFVAPRCSAAFVLRNRMADALASERTRSGRNPYGLLIHVVTYYRIAST